MKAANASKIIEKRVASKYCNRDKIFWTLDLKKYYVCFKIGK